MPKGADPTLQKPERIVLLILAASFVATGVAFLLAPGKLGAVVDITTSSKNGLIELRAFYGGIELGLGAFLAIAALRPPWHVPALWAATLALMGIIAARIYGISVEGSAGAMIYLFLLIEIVGLVLAVFGIAKTRGANETETSEASAAAELEPESPLDIVEKTVPIERTKVIEKTVRLERK